MRISWTIVFVSFFSPLFVGAQEDLPEVISGTLESIEGFKSKYVTSRHIDMWLPAGYSASKKYPVLYMHDGQMLYDPKTTWNGQAWEVDDVATALFQEKKTREFIVVGIWNGDTTRAIDYFPQKPFESLSETQVDSVLAQLQRVGRAKNGFEAKSDNYLKFLVEELKPHIDSTYSVLTDRDDTFIMGSSMGGLISMYAICEYPEVFGGAACLSTHWVGTFTLENNPIPDSFLAYLDENLPDPATHKFYFDCGDQTLDALYPAIQKRVDEVMMSNGFREESWLTKYFPGADHSENAWTQRLHIPITFLFHK